MSLELALWWIYTRIAPRPSDLMACRDIYGRRGGFRMVGVVSGWVRILTKKRYNKAVNN